MKNKKLLSVILAHFKLDEKTFIEASENEAGDESVLNDFTGNYQILKTADIETIKKNAKASGVEEHFAKADFDIDKDIPSPIAAKLLGRKLEGKQLALAKKYDVSDAKDIDDLIEKLVTKSKEGKGNPDQELLNQIATLKQTVIEKEKEVETVKGKYDIDEINRTFNSELTSLPLDVDDDKIENQRKILTYGFNTEFKIEKKGDTIIVLKKKGNEFERVNNNLGEPLPVKSVLTDFAKSIGLPFKTVDTGGRGDASSTGGNPSNKLKGVPFETAVENANKSLPEGKKLGGNTADMIDFRTKWKAENQN